MARHCQSMGNRLRHDRGMTEGSGEQAGHGMINALGNPEQKNAAARNGCGVFICLALCSTAMKQSTDSVLEISFRVESPDTQGMVDGLERFERFLAVGLVDIDDHIADRVVGLQVLARDVDTFLGQHLVDA